jgi:hypothetical protein
MTAENFERIHKAGGASDPDSNHRLRKSVVLSSNVQKMSGRARYANQAHKIRVTDGHEADAKAAQLRKRPNRIGIFFLKLLGYRGQVSPPIKQRDHAGPSHEHPGHHEHSTPASSCENDRP